WAESSEPTEAVESNRWAAKTPPGAAKTPPTLQRKHLEATHEVHAAGLHERAGDERRRAARVLPGLGAIDPRPSRQAAVCGGGPAASRRHGDERSRSRRQVAGHRWTLRGDPRAARRLL